MAGGQRSVRRWMGIATFATCLTLCGVVLSPTTTFAADEEKPADKSAAVPFAVVNIAGVERWQENVRYIFQAIERKDVADQADGLLSRVNDLKGVDRKKPFGLMVYLNGLNPTLVGYLPASNVEDLAKTLTLGPITAKKVDGKDDRYELTGGRRTLYARFQNGYGFVADNSDVVERSFPDPEATARTLTSRYDLAAAFNLDAIPEASRKLLLTIVKGQVEAQLQQRDNEPKGAYRVRRASGMNNMQLLEQLLTHARTFTLGWDVAADKKRAVMELALDVRPESALSAYLLNIGSKPTQFRGLLTDRSPLAFSFSWALDKQRREGMVEVFQAARESINPTDAEEAEKAPGNPAIRAAAGKLMDQAVATAEQGHIDVFGQMKSVAGGKFVFVGGLKVLDAESFGGSLAELLGSLGEKSPFKEVQTNVETHRGVALHKLTPKEIRGPDRALYGEAMTIHVGAGQKAIWFAVGGDDAAPALKQAIDAVAEAGAAPPAQDGSTDPVRFVLNMESWKELGATDRPQPGREVMKKAFAPGSDSLRVDVRPTENGARLRMEFDEGFLRWIALMIAQRVDRSQL